MTVAVGETDGPQKGLVWGTNRIRSFPTDSHPSASHSGTRSSFILHRRCACRRETRVGGRKRGPKGKRTRARAQRKPLIVLQDKSMDSQRHHALRGGREVEPISRVDEAAARNNRQKTDRTHTIAIVRRHSTSQRTRETMTLCDTATAFSLASLSFPSKTQSTCEPNQRRQSLSEAGRLRQDRVDGLMQDRHWKPPTRHE